MKSWFIKEIDSPVGMLKLVASDAGLAAILWPNDDPARVRFGVPVEVTPVKKMPSKRGSRAARAL